MDDPVVNKVTAADADVVEALRRLYPQLREGSSASEESVSRFTERPGCFLYVARAEGSIVGTVALVVHPSPGGGVSATIWSLVVDETQRRQGIGGALLRSALGEAKNAGAQRCSLRSAAWREPAHALYVSEGFHQSTSPNFDFNFTS